MSALEVRATSPGRGGRAGALAMSRAAVHLVVALAFLCHVPLAGHAREPQKGLPKIVLNAGGHAIRAEVAATEESRQKGLMYRTRMAANEGMLFVFAEVGYHAMWMRNTPLPLTVAFLDDKGVIVSLHDMEPHTETVHQAAGPVRFALEMNKGWFAARKVKVGDMIRGLEQAPAPK
jgi:hypothetical protein